MAHSSLPPPTPRSPGRPREFVADEVLDKAQQLFCARGYHATTVDDMRTALGLTTGSIYKAFKDKRTLFLAAFDRYVATRQERLLQRVAKAETGYRKLRVTLEFYADSAVGASGARGCLVVGAATDLCTLDAEIAGKVVSALTRNELMLRQLIVLGIQDGSIRATVDAHASAQFLLCLLQGMRVVGKVGASRKAMMAVVEQALSTMT